MDPIRAKIKAVRSLRGVSQEKMAEMLGIEQTTYSNWETGKIDLTLKNLERIATALQVDVKTFWDSEQFTDKNWKPSETLSAIVNEASQKYSVLRSKSKNMIPLSECEEIVHRLQEDIRKLQDQNWALSRSLNELFDKKLKSPV